MPSTIRVQLVADFGKCRGQTFSGVVVEPTYEAIMMAGINKLKLAKKKKDDLHLVLRDKWQGVRVLSADMNLASVLRDGALIVLTQQRPVVRVSRPPRWPWPGGSESLNNEISLPLVDAAEENDVACANKSTASCPLVVAGAAKAELLAAPQAAPSEPLDEWSGPWPVFHGNVLPLLREAISKTKGFIEKDMGDYIAFDYSAGNASELPEMFPDPDRLPRKSRARLLAAVRRECRGLLICKSSGRVLARRLPKFFNVDEVEESRLNALPEGGEATLKLDGSLVSPVFVGGVVRWATKSAFIQSVESFVDKKPEFQEAIALSRAGLTPIFEWLEVGPAVGAISHSANSLTLLAVRDNETGIFWPRDKLQTLGCAVVQAIAFENVETLLQTTRREIALEGVVVSWPSSGRFIKIKSSWWIALSAAQRKGQGQPALTLLKALEDMSLTHVPTELVWQALLCADDDQLSLLYGALPTDAQTELRTFAAALQSAISSLHEDLQEWARSVQEASDADIDKARGGWPLNLLVAYQRSHPMAQRDLRAFLLHIARSATCEKTLEALVGVAWRPSRQRFEYCNHLGDFVPAPMDVVEHVLDKYLRAKLASYVGHDVDESTPVRVERMYDPAEGKLKGMWEQFLEVGIIDLRVDLQPRAKSYDFHNGDADFAMWQVQFGPNDSCRRSTPGKAGDAKGAFAGVLMRTGVDMEYSLLRHAFELSFQSHKVVKLDPCTSNIHHIYLDLDGVLVDFDAGFAGQFNGTPDPKERWQYIERTDGFYEHLPWLKDGKRLWKHIKQLGLPVTVLSGIPDAAYGPRCAEEKKRWVAREMGNDVEVICCLSREKPSSSGTGRLLIDDRSQKGWEALGGRQILHRSVTQTLSALVDVGLGLPFSAALSDVQLISSLSDQLRFARENADAVALDVEWPPDVSGMSQSKASLLQLAFRAATRVDSVPKVFIIDLYLWDEELKEYIRELLESDFPKLVFGNGDAERLGMRISHAIDLQENGCSLAHMARGSGLLIKKEKRLQAGDWSQRPLRNDQLIYAATDALVLLELRTESATKAIPSSPATAAGGRNATIEYIGLFLTPESKRKLLRQVPPVFANVVADHMTLQWRPASVRGLAVGSVIKLLVTGVGCDDGVQAVRVETRESQVRSGHVTISHKQDVASVDANKLTFDESSAFTLDATLGVGVLLGGADRDMLPDSLARRVLALASGQPGESERFEGLTDSQRYAVHLLADELGLEHRSEGKKGSAYRKLVLVVPKGRKCANRKEVASGQQEKKYERTVVKDAKKFAAIFGDCPGVQLHGRITREGVEWQPGVVLPPALLRLMSNGANCQQAPDDRLVVVMRGFPGSGKSSVAASICKSCSSVPISADNYWSGTDGLHEAHAKCREVFSTALAAKQQLIVVDNTHVRKSDYAFYVSRAQQVGYEVVVLEIVCHSTADLEKLRARSVHNVPGAAVGAMWTRWEHDDLALRLSPYFPQRLMEWLQEHNMVNGRATTHLVMPRGPLLSIPWHAREEFHRIHCDEWGCNYISEIGDSSQFQLFFDIDGLELAKLIPSLASLRRIVGAPLTLVGFNGPSPGCHIHVPGKIVNAENAFEFRRLWMEAEPSISDHVDGALYKNPQLRMLGSRKISKDGVDTGRVYSLIGEYGEEWRPTGSSTEICWSHVSIHPPDGPKACSKR
eukprot:TRINITY_DN20923_c0_g1_i2.p1 TRINITY_DN20923_c0_g1~~TRINITY_DN20923_c0_g1_i2.p1  ORF type:complete len:1675 (-),score=201.37 TRINITY_DN20923_c0_g1_i2:157-5181(-)